MSKKKNVKIKKIWFIKKHKAPKIVEYKSEYLTKIMQILMHQNYLLIIILILI